METAIDELVGDFRRNPFVHRVEHSLHVQLFALLMQQEVLRERHQIGKTSFVTGLIQKDWPETKPRTTESGSVRRRGSFDLAVLAPSQMEAVQVLDQFIYGTIAAPIVIELGLGYQDDHLGGDEIKVLGSQVQHPYLVHFSRLRSRKQQATEALVNRLPPPIKVPSSTTTSTPERCASRACGSQQLKTGLAAPQRDSDCVSHFGAADQFSRSAPARRGPAMYASGLRGDPRAEL